MKLSHYYILVAKSLVEYLCRENTRNFFRDFNERKFGPHKANNLAPPFTPGSRRVGGIFRTDHHRYFRSCNHHHSNVSSDSGRGHNDDILDKKGLVVVMHFFVQFCLAAASNSQQSIEVKNDNMDMLWQL